MNETIKSVNEKYEAQNRLLENWNLGDLDERTLHQVIKSMLLNTIKDCNKYRDTVQRKILIMCKLLSKKDRTEDEEQVIKHLEEQVKNNMHLLKIAEMSLENVLSNMFYTDETKYVFRQEIPVLYENIYYLVDIEEEIIHLLVRKLTELNEISYKGICNIISEVTEQFILNAEDYIEDLYERDLYEEFVEERNNWIKLKKESANE